MMAPRENQALYLFYITGAECAGDLKGVGIDDTAPLFAHRYADFVALLSAVSIDDFCGTDAERRLADLGWVSERALRHERVIDQGFRRGPVLPARFGTLFSTLQVLESSIEQNRQMIGDFLSAVRGQEEWGIKTLLERPTAKKWLSDQMVVALDETLGSPGLRYLQERRAQAAAEKQLQQWLLDSCESVARALDEYATDRRQRKIVDDGLTGDSSELVLNLAVMVPHDRRADLERLIERMNVDYAEQGLGFVLNGPWPPYSFCPLLVMPP